MSSSPDSGRGPAAQASADGVQEALGDGFEWRTVARQHDHARDLTFTATLAVEQEGLVGFRRLVLFLQHEFDGGGGRIDILQRFGFTVSRGGHDALV